MQPSRPATAPTGHGQTLAAEHLSLPGIRVTDKWFVVGQRRFDVTELQNLRTVRGPHHPMVLRTGICAMIGVALIGLFFQQLPALGTAGAVAAVLLLGAVAQVINWRNPRSYEMWAEYRGLTIQLYYSDSERRYQAVCRALIRARERAWLQAAPASFTVAADASAAATQAWYSQAA
jgi:Family of unknown function (DUF6232)